jgi:dUTP pyrophosphatase
MPLTFIHPPPHAARPAVKVGDRIAQLVLERIATPEVEEVVSLEDTERGAGGFGSTGVASKQ